MRTRRASRTRSAPVLVESELSLRAAFRAETYQETEEGFATVRLLATTNAPVRRRGWFEGGLEPFDELLSFEPGAHRDERLLSGRAPFLLDHDWYSVERVIGALSNPVWDRRAQTLELTARLSRAPEFATIRQNIRDGITPNVSIGFAIHLARDVTERGDEVRRLLAIDWEILECSLVAIGADAQAAVRTAREDRDRRTILVLPQPQSRNMDPETLETTEQPAPATTPTRTSDRPASAPPAPSPEALREARAAEARRQSAIRARLRAAGLEGDQGLVTRLLDDPEVDEHQASTRILEELARRGEETEVRGQVAVGGEQGERLGRALESAILYRSGYEHLVDGYDPAQGQRSVRRTLQGNPYVHRSIMESAESFATSVLGVRGLGGLSKIDRAGELMAPAHGLVRRNLGASHATTDFAGILANVLNKVLRGTFELAPDTYSQWTRRGTLPDYKPGRRLQIGPSARLLSVTEGAEYTYGTVGEQDEAIVLAKYGRIIGFTREAMVNDDLDAFMRIPRGFGSSSRQLIADLVYLHLTGNTVMGDGRAIFSTEHANYVTGAGNSLAAAGIAALSNLRARARKQTAIADGLAAGGDTPFFTSVALRHLRVPPELETAAQQLTSMIQAQQVSNVNPFQGEFASVMTEPRLTDATAFYGFADPSMWDTIEVAFMQGEEGPVMENRIGFDRDGIEFKVRLDVGTAPIDFRGLYRNDGTT